MGAVKLSRDAEYQGIMPVRGKILNCLKADYAKIFKNEIITDLLKVMGCGVEVQDKHVKDLASFDLDSLRWNKVVICTDADVDGFQIRTLILTMLYRLTPTLIQMCIRDRCSSTARTGIVRFADDPGPHPPVSYTHLFPGTAAEWDPDPPFCPLRGLAGAGLFCPGPDPGGRGRLPAGGV